MLLDEFFKEHNENNGWFGPEEIPSGALRMVKFKSKPTKDHRGNNCFRDYRYFYLYICQTCGNDCITARKPPTWSHKDGLYNCGASSLCNRRLSKENMKLDCRGYVYYNVAKLD